MKTIQKKFIVIMAAMAAMFVVALPAGGITNGEPDTDHPYVGLMQGYDPGGTLRSCSGAIISDGVFLTAGHCAVLTDVTLSFDIGSDRISIGATEVLQHPDYAGNFGNQYDVGLVIFDGTAAAGAGTGVLAAENFVDQIPKATLKAATFQTIGYGLSRTGSKGNELPLENDGVRRIATQTYLNMHNQYLGLSIHTNKGNGGGCFGDSGGPHLYQGVIVSVTSNGDGNCVATDNTQRIDQPEIRNWILSHTS